MAVDWQAPSELPDLRRAGIIALDTETKDGGLLADRGSGWPVGDGYVCGSARRPTGGTTPLPLLRPDRKSFDRERVFQWLRGHVVRRGHRRRAVSRWGWLRAEAGIKMPPSERLEEIGALATIVGEPIAAASTPSWRGLRQDEPANRPRPLAWS